MPPEQNNNFVQVEPRIEAVTGKVAAKVIYIEKLSDYLNPLLHRSIVY